MFLNTCTSTLTPVFEAQTPETLRYSAFQMLTLLFNDIDARRLLADTSYDFRLQISALLHVVLCTGCMFTCHKKDSIKSIVEVSLCSTDTLVVNQLVSTLYPCLWLKS